MQILLTILGTLSIAQLILSLWALIDYLDHKIETFMEAKLNNSKLSDSFKDIAMSIIKIKLRMRMDK